MQNFALNPLCKLIIVFIGLLFFLIVRFFMSETFFYLIMFFVFSYLLVEIYTSLFTNKGIVIAIGSLVPTLINSVFFEILLAKSGENEIAIGLSLLVWAVIAVLIRNVVWHFLANHTIRIWMVDLQLWFLPFLFTTPVFEKLKARRKELAGDIANS